MSKISPLHVVPYVIYIEAQTYCGQCVCQDNNIHIDIFKRTSKIKLMVSYLDVFSFGLDGWQVAAEGLAVFLGVVPVFALVEKEQFVACFIRNQVVEVIYIDNRFSAHFVQTKNSKKVQLFKYSICNTIV